MTAWLWIGLLLIVAATLLLGWLFPQVLRLTRHLKISMVFVVVFIGIKLVLESRHVNLGLKDEHGELIPLHLSFLIVGGILAIGVVVSMLSARYKVLRELDSGRGDVKALGALAIRQVWRLIIFVIGLTVILLGVVVIVVPGPGPAPILFLLGLAILATEFVWARIMFKRVKAIAEKGADKISGMMPGSTPPSDDKPSLVRRWIQKIKVPGDKTDSDNPSPSKPS